MQSTELFSDNSLPSSAPEPGRPLQQLPENTMPSSQTEISWKCEYCPRTFQTDRGRKQHQGKCTSSVPKKVVTISDLSKQCLRGFKTQASSTVSSAVPITIKVISTIANNVIPNDPPVWGSLSSADLHQVVNAVYDEIVYWRKNLFMLPSGSAGKEYVCGATRLIPGRRSYLKGGAEKSKKR